MNTPNPKKAVIIEDFKAIAEVWQSLLTELDITTLKIFDCADNIEDEIIRLSPDLILMDINLRGKVTGLELTSKLVDINPKIRILVVTINSDGTIITKTQKSGARGYINKNSSIAELKLAIGTVLKDELYFDSAMLI